MPRSAKRLARRNAASCGRTQRYQRDPGSQTAGPRGATRGTRFLADDVSASMTISVDRRLSPGDRRPSPLAATRVRLVQVSSPSANAGGHPAAKLPARPATQTARSPATRSESRSSHGAGPGTIDNGGRTQVGRATTSPPTTRPSPPGEIAASGMVDHRHAVVGSSAPKFDTVNASEPRSSANSRAPVINFRYAGGQDSWVFLVLGVGHHRHQQSASVARREQMRDVLAGLLESIELRITFATAAAASANGVISSLQGNEPGRFLSRSSSAQLAFAVGISACGTTSFYPRVHAWTGRTSAPGSDAASWQPRIGP